LRFRIWYVYVALGILFMLVSVLFVYMAVSLRVDEIRGKHVDMSSNIPIFCCLPFFLPEALLFLALAVFSWKRAKNHEELASRLETFRIIKMSDLAVKMGTTEKKARKMVKRCIKKKYVNGRLDEKEETFYTTEYLMACENVIKGWECSHCGRRNNEIILPGEIGKCVFCGQFYDSSAKNVEIVKGEELLPKQEEKKRRKRGKEEEELPKGPRKIEPPAAIKEMMKR